MSPVDTLCATLDTIAKKISSGDHMTGSLSYNTIKSLLTFTLKDTTKRWTIKMSSASACYGGLAAYWIISRTNSGTVLPKFTKLKTSGDMATVGGVTGSIASFEGVNGNFVLEWTMVSESSSTTALATPTALSLTGNAFSIAWNSGGP